jgi:hypothetical protein
MKRCISERLSFSLLFSVLAVALVLGGSVARADSWTGQDLNLGGSYNGGIQMIFQGADTSEGGGPISPSSLDSIALAWVYCVDIPDQVNVPGNYTDTTVTNDGTVVDTLAPKATNGSGLLNNAGEVAYLLDQYAAGATTADAQIALQAAIWAVVYDGIGTGATGLNTGYYIANPGADSTAILGDYSTYTTGIGSDSVSNVLWFSPSVDGVTFDQALVGNNNGAVPEPASILLLGTLLLGVLHLLKRKLAPSQQ